MDAVLLAEFPWEPNEKVLLDKFRLKEDSPRAEGIRKLVKAAAQKGRPRALYRRCWIDSRTEDQVTLGGIEFHSRVMAVTLEKAHSAFPCVATCGQELEEWSRSLDGSLEKYCAGEIKGMALGEAVLAVASHVREHHCPGQISMMNPGSLEDWPLSGQAPLFALLAEPGRTVESVIGVRLLESYFMDPGMSASGIWFPSEERFENCMLCQREDCPGRRAPHDPDLFERKYRKPRSPR